MDWGAWIGLATLVLSIPLGVVSHFATRAFERALEKRKLTKDNESRAQAIREYDLIKELHNGTRDKYAHYLQLAGWSVIFGLISSTMAMIVAVNTTDLKSFESLSSSMLFVPLVLSVLFFITSLILMFVLYDRSRKVHRFSDYKADFIRKWGLVD